MEALEAMQQLSAQMTPEKSWGEIQPEAAPVVEAPKTVEPEKVVEAEKPVEAVKVEAEPVKVEPIKQPEQPAPKPEELERSLQALRRSKMPQKAIDALSPQELVALGAEHAKFWGEKDDNYRRLSELEKAKPQETRKDPNISAGTPDASTLFKELETELGSEVTGKLATTITRMLSAQAEAFKSDMETLKKAYEPLVANHARAEMEAARQRLTSKYEQLKDDAKFAKVFEKMSAWGGAGYDSIDAMIDDAARIVFADDLARKGVVVQEADQKVERQRDAGQLLSTTGNRDPRRLSEMERAQEAMRLLSEGKTPDEIKKLLGN